MGPAVRRLVVEFIGPPAAGKSYLTALTAAELNAAGVTTSMRTYTATHGRSRASELVLKVATVGRILAAHPGSAWRFWSVVRASRQPSWSACARLWFTWLFTRAISSTADAVELLDQGELQNNWSLGLEAVHHDVYRQMQELPQRNRPDLVVRVVAPDEEVLARLKARPGRASRLERVGRPVRSELLARGGLLFEEVISAATDLQIPVVVVAAGNDDDVAVAVAEIVTAVEQLSPEPAGPIRVQHVSTGSRDGQRLPGGSDVGPPDGGRPYQVSLITGTEPVRAAPMAAAASGRGISVEQLWPLRNGFSPILDLASVLALWWNFRRGKPAIVHTHGTKSGIVGRLAAWLAGVPVVVHSVERWSFHDYMPPIERAVRAVAERLAARVSTRIVVVAESQRALGVATRIGTAEQYVLIRSGVDLAPFRAARGQRSVARRALGIESAEIVVGSLGSLSEQKDPLTLVHAVAALSGGDGNVRLIFVSDGPLRGEVESLAEALGLNGSVQFLDGSCDAAEVVSSFDVTVLSSVWESLPLEIPASMAAGVPVVATDVGGVSEIVEDHVTGLLAPAHDAEALGLAIEQTLGDATMRAALDSAAARRAEHWDAQRASEQFDVLYRRLTVQ